MSWTVPFPARLIFPCNCRIFSAENRLFLYVFESHVPKTKAKPILLKLNLRTSYARPSPISENVQPNLAIPCAFVFPSPAQSRHTMRIRFSISGPISPYHAHSFLHLRPNLAIPCAFVFLSGEGQSRHTMRIPRSRCFCLPTWFSIMFSWHYLVTAYQKNRWLPTPRLPGRQNLYFQIKWLPSPRLPGHHNHYLLLELVSFRYEMGSWVGGYLSRL